MSKRYTLPELHSNNRIMGSIANDPKFPKINYLSWWIENTLEKRFPGVQNALDAAFNAVENTPIEKSDLCKKILVVLDTAQEQLCQAGESASMINNHLGGVSQEAAFVEKYIHIMENALAVLNKGLAQAVNGIKEALALVETYQVETGSNDQRGAINAALAEEVEVSASWLPIPHWLKQVFAYKEEELPSQPHVTPDATQLSPGKLLELKESLTKAYELAHSAAQGKYTSLHRTDIVNVLYESITKTSPKSYSPTSD